MTASNRLHYIDVLNCIAIFFVLILHSSQLAHFGSPEDSNYILALLLQTLCIPAVYIFFMNSGATLLDYREKYSTKKFFVKRIKRVLIPFLLWSVLYYIYDINHYAFPGPTRHPHPGIVDFINAFANNDINNLFWFFYSIIALYIATPILSVLVKKHRNTMFAIVVASFVLTDLFNYLSKLTGLKIMTTYLTQPLVTSNFVGYFVMGYLIKARYFSQKEENIFISLGLLALCLSIINDLTLMKFPVLNNIGPFLYSVSLYLIVKRVVSAVAVKNKNAFNAFKFFSGASLGIYILHPIAYEILDKYIFHATVANWSKFLNIMNNPYQMFLVPVLTYAVLSILIIFLKKIKIFNILIP